MSDRASQPSDGATEDPTASRTMDTLETFSLLAQETRLTILRELAATGTAGEPEPVSFAELRRRVGTRDSGRFNYHLDKLQPQFVTHVDEEDGPSGYQPTWAGVRVVGAAMAGQFDAESIEGETDHECPECGESATLHHEDGILKVECEDHELGLPVPAGAAENRTLDELYDVGIALTDRLIDLARRGVCPNCYDAITVEPVEVEEGTVIFRDTCPRCRATIGIPVGLQVGTHPGVVAFYYERGVELDAETLWESDWASPGAETIEDRDPFRLGLTVECVGDELDVLVDERGDPIELDGV